LISDQYILIGANEGLYTLNLNEIHESSLELVCIVLYITGTYFYSRFILFEKKK